MLAWLAWPAALAAAALLAGLPFAYARLEHAAPAKV
jgi:hypothetical protein